MRKNFAKAIKVFGKSEQLYIARRESDVFLSEGHIIEKVSVYEYNEFFRPASGRFVELKDGEKVGSRDGGIPEKANGLDIIRLWDEYEKNSTFLVNITPFLMEYSPDGKKKALQRMLTGNGYYVAINNNYYELYDEMDDLPGFFWNGGNSISGVFAQSENKGIVILPIRMNQKQFDNFIQAGMKKNDN